MGKTKARKAPGMYAAAVTSTAEQADGILARETAERSSLDWLRDLRDRMEVIGRLGSKRDDLTKLADHCYCLAKRITAPEFSDESFPEIVWHCYELGRSAEQYLLQREFDAMVSSSRVVSKASAEKGHDTSPLKDKQWCKVVEFITAQTVRGFKPAEAYRQASAQLATGELNGLRGIHIEIGADAIRKQYKSRCGKAGRVHD